MSDFVEALMTARAQHPEAMGVELLARKFGATRTTIERWFLGTAAPHPLLMKPVYAYLQTLVT